MKVATVSDPLHTTRYDDSFWEQTARAIAEFGGRQCFLYSLSDRSIELSFDEDNPLQVPIGIPDVEGYALDGDYICPESTDEFRDFFRELDEGVPEGSHVIRLHRIPDSLARWYRIDFRRITPSDAATPNHAIIVVSDITEYRENEDARFAQRDQAEHFPDPMGYIEVDLTVDRLLYRKGSLWNDISIDEHAAWDDVLDGICDAAVAEDDRVRLRDALHRGSLVGTFSRGVTAFGITYHHVAAETTTWWRSRVYLSKDAHSGNLCANILFVPLDDGEAEVAILKYNLAEMRKELRKSSSRLMLSQIQPHFLYNALSAIRSIVRTDPEYAYDLLYDFATHLRGSVKALAGDDPIPFSEELENIKAYLNIEQMRQRDRLRVVYDIRDDDFELPPLSVQPLAENAARHGVFPMGKRGGTITIRTFKRNGCHVVEVIDDGVGFDYHEVMASKKDSYGLKNLMYRLDVLSGATLDIRSEPGTGTVAHIVIPEKTDEHRPEDAS